MTFSKKLLSAIVIGTFATTAVYAKAETKSSGITSTEIGTLATIAAVDKNEILIAAVALNKKLNQDVNDFANMMINQHGDNLTQILSMLDNTHPLTGGEADKLTADGKKDLVKLGAMNGDAFANAYVTAMVNGHEAVLKLIDDKLLKTAKTEQMKQFLTDTRQAVATHLEHAKKLQDKMKA
jgi:putative membrane protein